MGDPLGVFAGLGQVERVDGAWLVLSESSYSADLWDALGAVRLVAVAGDRHDRPHSILIEECDHERHALKFKGLAITSGMTLWFPDETVKEKLRHV